MNKIICDICGTSYPETADQCPICGTAKDVSAESLLEEEVVAAVERPKGGRFAASSRKRQTRIEETYEEEEDTYEEDEEDYDEDDVDDEDDYDEDDYDDDDYDDDDDDEDDDDEEDGKSNTPLVILLVIVIAALLAVTGFIFVRYFLPNTAPEETVAPTVATTTVAPETTEAKVPCTSLAMTSGVDVLLEQEGLNWLLNVMALPENTTDVITYVSSDESVVTVAEDGTLTAVGEGEAVVTITCGTESIVCNVVCAFSAAETEAATEAVENTEAVDGTEATEAETEPAETEAPTEPTQPLKDIKLRVIRWADLTFTGPNQAHTFVLDGLKNDEVKWTSEDEKVVKVDENGYVISVAPGKTKIICQYGDQKIEIPVTCRW